MLTLIALGLLITVNGLHITNNIFITKKLFHWNRNRKLQWLLLRSAAGAILPTGLLEMWSTTVLHNHYQTYWILLYKTTRGTNLPNNQMDNRNTIPTGVSKIFHRNMKPVSIHRNSKNLIALTFLFKSQDLEDLDLHFIPFHL